MQAGFPQKPKPGKKTGAAVDEGKYGLP